MTKAQESKIERIKARFLERSGLSMEYKKSEVSTLEDSPLAFLYLVTGMVGDEGTMAQSLCRVRGHSAIGKRGGVRCLSLENGTRPVEKKYHKQYYR